MTVTAIHVLCIRGPVKARTMEDTAILKDRTAVSPLPSYCLKVTETQLAKHNLVILSNPNPGSNAVLRC